LGGLTVTELLRFDIVTAHLNGAVIFTTLLVIGTALTPYQGTGTVGKLPWVGLLATVLVYIQSLLGCLSSVSVGAPSVLRVEICVASCMSYRRCGATNPGNFGIGISFNTLVSSLRQLANLPVVCCFASLGLRRSGYICKWSRCHSPTVGAALLGSLVAFTVLALRDSKPWC